jgi:hypothetical protein
MMHRNLAQSLQDLKTSMVATLSPFIPQKSQKKYSANIARSGTVVAPRGAAARNGQSYCCFFSLKPASTVFFFFAPKNYSNFLYGVEKR